MLRPCVLSPAVPSPGYAPAGFEIVGNGVSTPKRNACSGFITFCQILPSLVISYFRCLRGSRLRLDYIVKKITNRKQHMPILKKLFTIYAGISDSIFGMTHDTMRQMRCASGRFNLKCPFRELTTERTRVSPSTRRPVTCTSIKPTPSYELRTDQPHRQPTQSSSIYMINLQLKLKSSADLLRRRPAAALTNAADNRRRSAGPSAHRLSARCKARRDARCAAERATRKFRRFRFASSRQLCLVKSKWLAAVPFIAQANADGWQEQTPCSRLSRRRCTFALVRSSWLRQRDQALPRLSPEPHDSRSAGC